MIVLHGGDGIAPQEDEEHTLREVPRLDDMLGVLMMNYKLMEIIGQAEDLRIRAERLEDMLKGMAGEGEVGGPDGEIRSGSNKIPPETIIRGSAPDTPKKQRQKFYFWMWVIIGVAELGLMILGAKANWFMFWMVYWLMMMFFFMDVYKEEAVK